MQLLFQELLFLIALSNLGNTRIGHNSFLFCCKYWATNIHNGDRKPHQWEKFKCEIALSIHFSKNYCFILGLQSDTFSIAFLKESQKKNKSGANFKMKFKPQRHSLYGKYPTPKGVVSNAMVKWILLSPLGAHQGLPLPPKLHKTFKSHENIKIPSDLIWKFQNILRLQWNLITFWQLSQV